MSDNPIYDYISSAAVSLTMAGNTGISPFLTLLILGVIEMVNPELLNMGETMEILLASWWSVVILGVLAIVELVGKCIPAVDEVIDSAEVFVVPLISILATMATMGLLPVPEGSQLDAGQGQNIDAIGIFDSGGDGFRNLQEENDADLDQNNFGEGFMTFTKFSLVAIGMGLSLAIHFYKMLVRVSSLVCSGGCCQPCITIMEYVLVVFGVVLAILAPAFAIVACIALLVAAGYIIWVKCCQKKENDSETKSGEGDDSDTKDNKIDEENQSTSRASKSEFASQTPNPPADAFAVGDFVDVPLPSPMSPKLDVAAITH
jgi:hypothetical protein